MINNKELVEYRTRAEAALTGSNRLTFDHYGIQAKDPSEYCSVISEMGGLNTEVFFGSRHIATVSTKAGIVEIYEPKPNTIVTSTYVDHIAYYTDSIETEENRYSEQIVSRFEVGSTRGFKAKLADDLVIEFRNNRIIDSVKDFS